MPKFIKPNDKSHVSGMDTVRDYRADTFGNNKNLLMRNIFPGDPPIPRNGCQDVLVDINPIGYGGNHTLFKPPALVTRVSGSLFVFVYHIYEQYADELYYALEVWDIDGISRIKTIYGKWSVFANFGLLNLFGRIYGFTNYDMEATYPDDNGNIQLGKRHKFVEYRNGQWGTRDLCIEKFAGSPGQTVNAAASGLTGGLWVSYAFTYVRRDPDNDFFAFLGGEPIRSETFSPGLNEGYEQTSDRAEVELTTTTDSSYGDSTTEISVNEVEDGIFRYEYASTGTNPNFNSIPEGTWIDISGDNFFASNAGIFKVRRSSAAWLEVANASGEEQAPFLIGSDGSIKTRSCTVTLDMPAAADIAEAIKWGATHLRIWRTDHAVNREVAQGLTHRYLVDIPLYGPDIASFIADGILDSVSRNALEGETNFLVMTNYTAAPSGRFSCYNAFRLFLGGNPDKPGRWYYTEAPGADGGTTLADIFPMRYMSMFKPTLYYVDFDPDDGQVDTGCAVLRDDNYFFKEKKCSMLHNGDITRAPDEVSNHLGCVFPNTIVVANMPRIGEFIFFMSAEGPCIIRPGGTIQLLAQFSIKELWPEGELLNKTNGELMNEYIREKVHAKVHQNTIWVLYGDSEDVNSAGGNQLRENHVFGYYEGAEKPFAGCMEIDFEDFSIFWHIKNTVTAQKGTHVIFTNPFVHTKKAVQATTGTHQIQIDDQKIVFHTTKVVIV